MGTERERKMKATIPVILTIFQLLGGSAVEAAEEWKAVNKRAVKTIRTEYGDTYDCVNVQQQPSLDHPLLKGHVVQMEPSAGLKKSLKESNKRYLSLADDEPRCPIKIGLEDGCPQGTVPIRRTTHTRQDLMKINSQSTKPFFNNIDDHPAANANDGYQYAGISTRSDSAKVYHGAGAYLDLYNPKAENEQISASMVMLSAGPWGKRGAVRTGWMINPLLYGDSRTRIFTSWTQENNGATSGCYDVTCQGFIQTSQSVPLGLVISNISQIGGQQFLVYALISQDPRTGDWWLTIADEKPIGYWPNALFESLRGGGSQASWVGMVYSGSSDLPPMGSGVYREGIFDETCCMLLVVLGHLRNPNFTPPGAEEVVPVVQKSRCYSAGDNSYVDENWGYRFMFGGPGGTKEACN